MIPLDRLAESLVQHLQDEETLLRQAVASLSEVSDSLRKGDLATLAAARVGHESLAAALQQAAASRQASAEALAAAIGVPADRLTLKALANRLPDPWAAALGEARTRLTAAATELSALQRRNANLINCLRSYLRAALSAADGPVRYGPSGAKLTTAAGRLIQASG